MLTLTLDSQTTLTAASAATDPTINAPRAAWSVLSGLAHDLRQPLSIIEACADYLDLILPREDLRSRAQIVLVRQQVADANRILGDALVNTHYGKGHPSA
jgi:nitrogen-specific signal transduction histidine kinase